MNTRVKHIMQCVGSKSTKYGGLEKWIISIAEELLAHSIKLVLVYNAYPQSDEYLRLIRKNKVKLVVADSARPFSFFFRFLQLCFQYRPAIIHVHFQPFYPLLYAFILGCKHRFYSVRLMLLRKDLTEADNKKQIKAKQRFYLPVLNFVTTKMLAVSNAVMEQYTSFFQSTRPKLSVLYNGVSENHYVRSVSLQKLNFTNDQAYIGCIGFDSTIKGLDLIVEAAKIMRENHGSLRVHYCLIGLDEESDYTFKLKEIVNGYGLNEQFSWFGIINNVPEVLAALDIYCQPSRTEALPNAVMEAGMAGLPAIGADVGGMREVIRHDDTGYLFDAGNAAQLANYLYLLISDPERRAAMGGAAKHFIAANFNRESKVNEIVNLYLDTLKIPSK